MVALFLNSLGRFDSFEVAVAGQCSRRESNSVSSVKLISFLLIYACENQHVSFYVKSNGSFANNLV